MSVFVNNLSSSARRIIAVTVDGVAGGLTHPHALHAFAALTSAGAASGKGTFHIRHLLTRDA